MQQPTPITWDYMNRELHDFALGLPDYTAGNMPGHNFFPVIYKFVNEAKRHR